jgi:hypothetical protein
MKKYSLFLLFAITIIPLNGQSEKKVYPITSEPVFKDGEELKYVLRYGFITGGSALIKVLDDSMNGRKVIRATATAKTTGLVDKIFRVLDTYESYFIPDSNLPLKAVRNIREGSYRYYGEDVFNHNDNTVINTKKGVQKVPDNILDIISAFFYIRRIDFTNFKIGETIYVDTYFGDEHFPFYVIFKGREEIETHAGKFKCLKFLPIVEPGRVFKDKDDMLFWLSDDNNKIPVKVKFDMLVGAFKCELVSYKNLKFEAAALIKK